MRNIIYNGDFDKDLKEKKKYKWIVPKVVLGLIIWSGIEYGSFLIMRPYILSSIPARLLFMGFTVASISVLINILNKINEKGWNAIKRLKSVEHEMKVDNKDLTLENNSLNNLLELEKTEAGYVDDNNNKYKSDIIEYEYTDANDVKEYIEYIKSNTESSNGEIKQTNYINVYNNDDPKALKKILK